MRFSENTRRYLSATSFMVVGSIAVFGSLLVINKLAEGPDQKETVKQTKFRAERQDKPEPSKVVKREEPKKPDVRQAAPDPLKGLDSRIGSVDLGIPSFDASDLQDAGAGIDQSGQDVVMTDDTVDVKPRPKYRGPLKYPSRARAKGIEGYVVLNLLITESGQVKKIKVLESKPGGVFEDRAVSAVQGWRFEPAKYNGKRVRVWARQTIRFDLS